MSSTSIVIPVHDGAALTRRCLDALLVQDLGGAELVVVDDGSADSTAALLEEHAGRVRSVVLSENGGFAAACNAGVAASRGDRIVLLNNDTVPEAGWLGALERHADAHPRAAAIGAKLLWPAGLVQHAGVVIDHRRDVRHLYAGLPADHPAVGRSRRFQVVTGACMLVRRDAFEALGGFDAAFVNGYEDVDFCLRAGEAGWEVWYCADSVVHHLESASRGHGDGDRENRRRYLERWGERVQPDDLRYYVEDGLLAVDYEWHRVAVTVSPLLGRAVTDREEDALERALAERSRQAFDLLRETARLARDVRGWDALDGRPRPQAALTAPAPGRPDISVIVPVSDHSMSEAVLAALARQSAGAGRLEVLLVAADDAPPDAGQVPGGLRVRCLHAGTHGGRAAAFNLGVRNAAAELVLLLADDLVPTPEVVAEHLAAHRRDQAPEIAAVGPALFPDHLRADPFRCWIEDSGELFGRSFTATGDEVAGFFYGANTSLRRSFLLEGEMFDERLSLEAWDDYELGRRLGERGMRVVPVPRAVAMHEHPLTFSERMRVMHRAGRSAARYDLRYPAGHPWHSGTHTGQRAEAALGLRAARARARHLLLGRDADLHAYWRAMLRRRFLHGYRAEASALRM